MTAPDLPPTVTEADRLAAHEFIRDRCSTGVQMMLGAKPAAIYDAFARHRTASTAALRAENEALRALLGDTRALVVACCPSGFTDEQAVMALYQNNGRISAALGAAHG